ncbi:M28 family metallopeptidase [Gaopeijia maritima]|uniref:M28 family metallopeptidase n=1 Tax=Gaopeijia maritima TaxID=3119007 RepID=UPI00326DE693
MRFLSVPCPARPVGAFAFTALVLTGCGGAEPAADVAADGPAPDARPLSEVQADVAASTPAIDAHDLGARIEWLAHDDLEGRAPSTPGGQRTSQWIADEMARIGLEPMSGDSYFQSVPLVEATLDPAASHFTLTGPSGDNALEYGPETIFWTKRLEEEVSFDASEVVFVGYGSVAPEYGWDDYAGLDATGKTVVMLVNDPGYATGDPALFNGRSMTYYGRWTYKYEEAGRQGATAAIVIHETEPASYGWRTVASSWSGAQYDLVRGDAADPRPMLEGWITRPAAEALFAEAGLDFETLKAAAAQPGFTPVALEGVTASGALSTSIATRESRNVGGVLRGAERPDEYVLYTAHWDHLGVAPEAEAGETLLENASDDRIFNGAVDNATGTAGILEIAESWQNTEAPARSILFLAVTAEESGLLGSEYFAVNPTVPLASIVGGLNIDAILPTGPSRDLVVVGFGASELEDELEAVAGPLGKTLTADPSPEAGYFYRSDHISLAKRGVPMLYTDAGKDLVDGGTAAGAAFDESYTAERYHAVGDEYDASWDLGGMIEVLEILRTVGANLAASEAWPNWYEGNEFRGLRDAMRPGG